MALRLVGGSGESGEDERRDAPQEKHDLLLKIGVLALALHRACCDAGGVSPFVPAHRAPDGADEVLARPAVAVGVPIDTDLDSWELDRKRQNRRGIHADKIRLQAVIVGCGWKSIESATPDSLLRWLGVQREGGWKGATANKVQTLVSTLLADVARRNPSRLVVNWARGLPRAATDDSDDGSRAMAWGEYAKLRKWCRKHAPHRLDAYDVMGHTGMRYTEGRRLMLTEVKLDENPRIVLGRRTKRGKPRTIPIVIDILPTVRRLCGKRKDGMVFAEFPTIRTLRRDCARAGVDPTDVGYHSLRKCFAGRCATTGVPLAVAQKILGHSDPKLTANIYTRFQDHELAEQLAGLGDEPRVNRERKSQKKFDRAHATDDDGAVEALDPMHTLKSTSRRSVPGRSMGGSTLQQRDSSALRPGTKGRESHLRDLNPGPMLYESTGRETPGRVEATAKLLEDIAAFLRGGVA